MVELIEGDTLDTRIQRGPLTLEDALRIAREIADALEGAHAKGIVHQDLKPSTIKLTADGVVKALDFGLTQAGEGGQDARAGLAIGTAAYMSPEQTRGHPVDTKTNIWSFGCVLFEMLSGHVPFDGETVTDTVAAVVQREPNWVLLPRTTPLTVRRIIGRCLQKDPAKRLSDIGDAKIDIEDVINGQPRRRRGAIARWIGRLALAAGILAAVIYARC